MYVALVVFGLMPAGRPWTKPGQWPSSVVTVHAGFFAVVNQEDYGVARPRERFADARDFEDGGGSGAVVESARTGGNRIVMRG